MRVLVFGDSVASGFYDIDGGWVERIRRIYDEKKINGKDEAGIEIYNLGISGDMSKNILDRMESEIAVRKWPGDEQTIIISTGINDTIFRGEEHASEPSQYANELSEILAIAKKFTNKVMFVGLWPVVDKLLQPFPWSSSGKCYSTERVRLFEATLTEFCNSNSVGYVQLWESFEKQPNLESVFFDGLHPNSVGHQLIADLVKPRLEELIP